MNDLISEIEAAVGGNTTTDSEIVYAGGEQNIGCIVTKTTNKDYLTKVSIGYNRECFFYTRIYPILLKQFNDEAIFLSPFIKLIRLKESNIHAVVMRKITGTNINILETMQKIITLNQRCSSITYRDLTDQYPFDELHQAFVLFHPTNAKDPITALHSFSGIHKQENNESLFRQVKKHFRKRHYRESVAIFDRLEQFILTNKMYEKVDPNINYTLQHGDLFEHNLIQHKDDVFYIDWGCARFGPKGLDMAGFLGRLKMPFEFIFKHYIHHQHGNHLSHIDKILFLYMLMITWLIVYEKDELDNIAATDLQYAIDQLEQTWKDLDKDNVHPNC
ncbi:phosphotransferase [Litchfieldia alkalitelluris]|uniref:phosphotransferase n=1 Tax=Litchfieldia alkalitelluris TaxID=304268 RepID=UPI0011171637|nr:phosphotransferase [Litchfieldia alkalitelluris]